MLTTMLGAALMFLAVNESAEVEPAAPGAVHYQHPTVTGVVIEHGVQVRPLTEFRFHNVVRQAYDYSCGSAALTTLLNGYLGHRLEERQVMEGLLQYGQTEQIVARRGFSLLDMRQLARALGYDSGGYRAAMKDLRTLEHPAIVPITYGGFHHFVVLKGWRDGYLYVADPAMGNLRFPESVFEQIWEQQVVFMVFPRRGEAPQTDLALTDFDLRMIDDRTLNQQLVFREFPLFTRARDQWLDRAGSLVPVLTRDAQDVERVINIPTRTYYRSK